MSEEIKVKGLSELLKKSDALDMETEKIHEKMQEELESNRAKIEEKYKEKEEPINKKKKLLYDKTQEYLDKYIKCATFDSNTLGSILKKLVTVFEGEEYCYQEADYHTEEIDHGDVIGINKKVRVIVKLDKKKYNYKKDWYKLDQIKSLVNDGYMIVLEESEENLNYDIVLYEDEELFDKIYDNVDYGRFTYVKDFIRNIINYRFKNNLININCNDMEKLLCEYVLSKKEIIESNYLLRKEEEQKKYQEKLEEDKKEYQEKIEEDKKEFSKQLESVLRFYK